MRVRYSRCPRAGRERDYEVRTQEKPRGRWARRGIVSGLGARSSQWAALGDGARAWTCYRATRAGAVADMLAGRTFLDAGELAGGSRAAAGRQGFVSLAARAVACPGLLSVPLSDKVKSVRGDRAAKAEEEKAS